MRLRNGWQALGEVPPDGLTDARLQLHWAAQTVAAVANGLLEGRPDDGQSNLGWDAALAALTTHTTPSGLRAALRVAEPGLVLLDDRGGIVGETALEGLTLPEALSWLDRALANATGAAPALALTLRDYDMPGHPVRHGAPFSLADRPAFAELARWFAGAYTALGAVHAAEPDSTMPRCWPHHFDVGMLVLLDPEKGPEHGRSIGLGLSPGDKTFPEPYFYVNPHPRPKSTARSRLAGGGEWYEEAFFGAILRGSDLVTSGKASAQLERVGAFLASAVAGARQMLGAQRRQKR